MNKGQISLIAAIIGSISLLGGSFITAWATTGVRVNVIDTKIQVVEEREQNHYLELTKRLDSIDYSLKELLKELR